MCIKAKRDSVVMTLFSSLMVIITAVLLVPLFIFNFSNIDKFVSLTIFLLIIVLFMSFVFFIKYEFHDDYLYIKGGLFVRRIRYDTITHVESSNFTAADLLIGDRILSSRDGVVINYKAGLGSMKISPRDKSIFISELEKRIANVGNGGSQ